MRCLPVNGATGRGAGTGGIEAFGPRHTAISGYWVPRRRSDDTPRHISRHQPRRTSRAGWSSAVGATLSAGIRTMAALRLAPKPLHPEGVIVTGTLERRGSAVPVGRPGWTSRAGTRSSYGSRGPSGSRMRSRTSTVSPCACPRPRVSATCCSPRQAGASSGASCSPSVAVPESRPMTTLLPYRTAEGPALLGVRATDAQVYEMSWCRPRGEWHAFAELRLTDDDGTQPGDVVRPGAQPAARPHAVRLGTAAPGAVVPDRQEVAPAVTATAARPQETVSPVVLGRRLVRLRAGCCGGAGRSR